ncbi:MAG: hypothetical protein ACRD3Z_04150, partial [Nitrososphaerales archaeon]
LMVQRLDGKQVNAQPLVVDQTYLGSFPKLATAIEKSDNLIDPVLGPRAYQDRLSQVEADAIMNTLKLQHVNTADNYDDQGNKIGTVELYSTLVQLNGKSYGITLVFQK